MDTGAGLVAPYMGITPAPAQWPAVEAQFLAQGVTLVWLDSGRGGPTAQLSRMLSDLGEPASNHHSVVDDTALMAACSQITAQVRTLAGL